VAPAAGASRSTLASSATEGPGSSQPRPCHKATDHGPMRGATIIGSSVGAMIPLVSRFKLDEEW
jgi:hypothetical protein